MPFVNPICTPFFVSVEVEPFMHKLMHNILSAHFQCMTFRNRKILMYQRKTGMACKYWHPGLVEVRGLNLLSKENFPLYINDL